MTIVREKLSDLERASNELEARGMPTAARLARAGHAIDQKLGELPEAQGLSLVILMMQPGHPNEIASAQRIRDENGNPVGGQLGDAQTVQLLREGATMLGMSSRTGALEDNKRQAMFDDAVELARTLASQYIQAGAENPCNCGNCELAGALGMVIAGARLLVKQGVSNAEALQLVQFAKELSRVAEVEKVRKSAIGSA